MNSPGFGIGRFLWRHLWDIEAPEVAQPEPAVFSAGDFDANNPHPTAPAPGFPKADEVWETHYDGLFDFVNARGFGYVKDRRNVAGFRSHRFRYVPYVPTAGQTKSGWEVKRVELVSLLKNPRPTVYVSEHLPRMDELRAAPTRPLDGFEAAMLPALQQGEDLKLDYGPDTIRMLGAIRAGEQCLKCHDGQRGDMLGAFSYRLRRGTEAVKTP